MHPFNQMAETGTTEIVNWEFTRYTDRSQGHTVLRPHGLILSGKLQKVTRIFKLKWFN